MFFLGSILIPKLRFLYTCVLSRFHVPKCDSSTNGCFSRSMLIWGLDQLLLRSLARPIPRPSSPGFRTMPARGRCTCVAPAARRIVDRPNVSLSVFFPPEQRKIMNNKQNSQESHLGGSSFFFFKSVFFRVGPSCRKAGRVVCSFFRF